MASQQANASYGMFGALGRFKELRQRILFVLFAIFVYRVFSHVPVPGIDPVRLAEMFDRQSGTILDMFNMFSGGALQRLSVVALGVMPYITASIIVQLFSMIEPRLKELRKEGEQGKRKITQYTRYLTLVFASVQSIGIALLLENQGVVLDPGISFRIGAVVSLVTGSMFLMWLGEQMTERGVGNGISLLIFASIVSGLPGALGGMFELARNGELSILGLVFLLLLMAGVTWAVVFIEKGQRRITVNYPKRQVGRKQYAEQSSYLPLKLNMSGVIPPIFATSLVLFPSTVARWLGDSTEYLSWLKNFAGKIAPGEPLYVAFYAVGIIFFCFFYTALVFDSKETADTLKKQGAFVPGLRPGQQTMEFVDAVITRLTVAGAIYVTTVCLLPEFLTLRFNVPFYFGGTSLLIIVVVIMDFIAQIQAHLFSHQYESLSLRKRRR